MWAPRTTTDHGRLSPNGEAPRFSHPDFAGAVTYTAIARAADDEQATADTVTLMRAAIATDAGSPAVAQATAAAIAARPTDPIAGIFDWIKRRVRFVPDRNIAQGIRGLTSTPDETEVLIRPADLLQMPAPHGDCDDFSMLTAAMLQCAGIPAHLMTIEADPAAPGQYSHIYAVAEIPGRHVAMDTSHGPRPGWFAPPVTGGKHRKWKLPMITRTARPRTMGDTTDLSQLLSWSSGAPVSVTPPTDWTRAIEYGPITSPAAASTPSIWDSILPSVIKDFSKAGAASLQMSQTPKGFYQQIGPNGQITYLQPQGTAALSLPGLTSTSSGGLLFLLALGLGAIFLFRSKS